MSDSDKFLLLLFVTVVFVSIVEPETNVVRMEAILHPRLHSMLMMGVVDDMI